MSIAEYGNHKAECKENADSLEAKGYVAVSRSRQDARALEGELTYSGISILQTSLLFPLTMRRTGFSGSWMKRLKAGEV